MLTKEYPLHDMNVVFDMIEQTLSKGDCANNAMDEMNFINRLMAALPAEAVEYGMQFLHGEKNLPKACDDILPLYIRFVNLVSYCEKIEALRDIPTNITTEAIMARKATMDELDKLEEGFGKPLLGYKMNADVPQAIDTNSIPEANDSEEEAQGEQLHLMNAHAAIFICEDPLKTSLFYETKCGFKAVHLDDEVMPHIRLDRDNISIALVEGTKESSLPMRERTNFKYDMYIYASEPMLLQATLEGAGVKIIEKLGDAKEEVNSKTNRQFVFEDCDRRYICVSQQL